MVMTRYVVRHTTTYSYERPMTSSQMVAFLVPRSTPTQTVVGTTVTCLPVADHRHTRIDGFGNLATYLSIEQPHDWLEIVAESVVEVAEQSLPADRSWEATREQVLADTSADGQLAQWCLLDSPYVAASDELAAFGAESFRPGRGILESLRDLSGRIFREFAFDPAATDVSTPLHEVLADRRGVCQDFAHLTIACLRSLGLPARYVSGYIETEPPAGEPKLVGTDASHAWCATYLPGAGWVDVDPTNDAMPPTRHVSVAWARDYGDVAPVRGVTFGPPSHELLTVSVDVARMV